MLQQRALSESHYLYKRRMLAVATDFRRARNPGPSRVSMTDTTCVMKIHQTITTKIVVSLS